MPTTRQFSELAAVGGLDLVASDVFMGLLVGSPTLTPNLRFVDELAEWENDDASYDRVLLTTKSWAWDPVNYRLEFFHDNPNFGHLDGDPPTYGFYGIDLGGPDYENPILGYFEIPNITPSGANDFVVTVGSEGGLWV